MVLNQRCGRDARRGTAIEIRLDDEMNGSGAEEPVGSVVKTSPRLQEAITHSLPVLELPGLAECEISY